MEKKTNSTVRHITKKLDQVIINAYKIYEKDYPDLNGWQRDYIYYGIEPNNTEGPFSYDFQEHIRSFSMSGDAEKAYNKISDQTGDPSVNPIIKENNSHWTGGFFEFKVRTIINAKNGIGNELINGFTVSPSELFGLTYEEYPGLLGALGYYKLKNIYNKTIIVDLPIINWDLDQYASSIKIEIEEVDLSETTVITDSRTVKFATNFDISSTLGEKVKLGLKFGASLETNETHTVQRTFTQGNDFLGEVIVNFADKVVLRKINGWIMGSRWITRDYTTGLGYCKFSVEPKRVQ